MRTQGPLQTSGRDADIYDYGPGLVLRRSRGDRSQAYEAAVMDYLLGQGYRVPRIDELSEDGRALAMERIEGPSMAEYLAKAPWALHRQAKVLAGLHRDLHQIPPPDFLRPAPVGQGGQIVHLDLHPLNVIIGPSGPVVIDFTNTARGDPSTDIGLAWLLVLAGEIPARGIAGKLLGLGRRFFAKSFLAEFDRAAVARQLPQVVAWKERDAHMSRGEVAEMWKLANRAANAR